MFAILSKEIISQEGRTNGEIIISNGIKKYGNQRGHRMALRAINNGDDLSLWNYLAYQEWKVPKRDLKKTIKFDTEYVHSHFLKCPWVVYWNKHNVLEYGKLFCPNTDYALFEGFNPAINIQLIKNRANGDECCDFHFINVTFSFLSAIKMLLKRIKLGNAVIMPWEYHTAHILFIFKEILMEELGVQGDQIISNVQNEFSKIFSNEAMASIMKYKNNNFNTV